MAEEKTEQEKIDAQVEVNKLTEQVTAEERKRLGGLKGYFIKDLEFALKAFEKGKNLIEAKADYCDILMTRIAAVEKELTDIKNKSAGENKSSGNHPVIESGNSDNSQGSGRDFLEEARALAKSQNTTVTMAMKKLARTEPALYEAYREKTA
jgi:hypothetical protein